VTEISFETFEIARLRLKPGDRVVIRVPESLTQERMEAIARVASAKFHPHPVVVMPKEFEIEVLDG
jgi:hypothetical protein